HYAARRRVNTLVVLASFFEHKGWFHRLVIPPMVRLLNRPTVRLVGNHRWPATQSLLDCGLDPAKAVAWDWPAPRRPPDYPAKRLLNGHEREIVFAGMVTATKGVPELVEAVGRLRRGGTPVRLTLLGEGDALRELRAQAPDGVELAGRVGNDEVFARMRAADLVCVPSRPQYA